MTKKDAKNKYFPLHEGDRVRLSGDSCDLGIKDYNVRVDSEATVVVEPHDDDSKVLVNIDYIDGESNVWVSVKRDKLSVISLVSFQGLLNVHIYDIKWDTDGETVDLPTEVDHTFDGYNDIADEDLMDEISDWLSDEYGFCHFGFQVRENKADKI